MKRDPRVTESARRLRREMTPAETILWKSLRGRRFAAFKFRRQHPVEPYYVDFYCAEVALVLEIDGETHLGKEVHDAQRQEWLESHGLHVMRFWNTEVYDETEAVEEAIWRTCDRLSVPSSKG